MHTHIYIYTYIYIKDIETSTKEHILHHDAQSFLKTVTQKRKIQAEDKELTELAHRKMPRHTHTHIYKGHILHHDAQSFLKTVTQKRKIQAEDKELTELAHRKTPRLIKVWYEAASFCNS